MDSENKNLIQVSIFVLLVLGFILFRSGFFTSFELNSKKDDGIDQILGIPLQNQDPKMLEAAQVTNLKRSFSLIKQCLELKGDIQNIQDTSTDMILKFFENEFGLYTRNEKSTTWKFRSVEGKERQLKLALTELEDGSLGRELSYFQIENKGEMVPILQDQEKIKVGSDDVIMSILRGVEVSTKDIEFEISFNSNGEIIRIFDENGRTSKIEIKKESKKVRCHNLNIPTTCLCE